MRVLLTFPTSWDAKQIRACGDSVRDYEVLMGEPDDLGCPWDFDVVSYIPTAAESYRGKIDGVTSSSDYPGATVAAAIATRLGLPGSPPETVIRCSHKYYSRLAQRESVPEATPPFWLVDPRHPDNPPDDIEYPCFIKPVKGAFSVMAKKINDRSELEAFLARPTVQEFAQDYVAIFNRLVAGLTDFDVSGSFFLAEGFLRGRQVTVEGFDFQGEVHILGIVDSIMHPGTASFARFDYPSALRREIQDRMADVARRAIKHLGLRDSLFNIEMIYQPATDDIYIIEINPRLCGQFADLYQKVDGVNGFQIALALASGQRPTLRRGKGRYAAATSFPLRSFVPVRVVRSPSADKIEEVEAKHDGALIWWECEQGQELSDFERLEDGHSVRYGVVNIGARTRTELRERLQRIEEDLDYRLENL